MAQVVNPRTGKVSVTNVFHYTFLTKEKIPPRIIPKTYHEVTDWQLQNKTFNLFPTFQSMMFLNGRRNFQSRNWP